MFKGLFDRARFRLKPLVEENVYVQYYAFQLLYYCKFLLPHDADYNGAARLPLEGGPSGCVLDVGANLGLSALSFRKLLPGAKIVSLEPNPVHQKWLERIKRKDSNFDYRMVGAGETNASTTLHVPFYKRVPLHTMAAVSREDVEDACRGHFRHRYKHIRIEQAPITIVPIDQLQLSPTLVKVDAEGFELSIIKGALETIRRARPCLLLENNPKTFPAVFALLAPLGYRRFCWENTTRAFTAEEREVRNVYLLPEEKAPQAASRRAAA
jgi:FkbM family methyltransferase